MSLKTLANKATSAVGKQVISAQQHVPTFLIAAGIIGVGTSVVLACKATLKLEDTLKQGEAELKHIEVKVTDSDDEVTKKAGFDVRLKTAIKVVRLYAPSTALLAVSVGAIVGSQIILQKRIAGVTAAYAIVQKGFDDYRGRVRKELGDEKDLEFRWGVSEREVVEETPDGPKVRTIKGLDQEAIQKDVEAGLTYARIFGPELSNGKPNPNWEHKLLNNNKFFIQMVLGHCRDALEVNGYLFLSDVYDMFGFERTIASTQVGWVLKPQYDENGKQTNDGYVDFGAWSRGVHAGKEWVTGFPEAYLLDFNVDGDIRYILKTI
jgi:hypothetical protein